MLKYVLNVHIYSLFSLTTTSWCFLNLVLQVRKLRYTEINPVPNSYNQCGVI